MTPTPAAGKYASLQEMRMRSPDLLKKLLIALTTHAKSVSMEWDIQHHIKEANLEGSITPDELVHCKLLFKKLDSSDKAIYTATPATFALVQTAFESSYPGINKMTKQWVSEVTRPYFDQLNNVERDEDTGTRLPGNMQAFLEQLAAVLSSTYQPIDLRVLSRTYSIKPTVIKHLKNTGIVAEKRNDDNHNMYVITPLGLQAVGAKLDWSQLSIYGMNSSELMYHIETAKNSRVRQPQLVVPDAPRFTPRPEPVSSLPAFTVPREPRYKTQYTERPSNSTESVAMRFQNFLNILKKRLPAVGKGDAYVSMSDLYREARVSANLGQQLTELGVVNRRPNNARSHFYNVTAFGYAVIDAGIDWQAYPISTITSRQQLERLVTQYAPTSHMQNAVVTAPAEPIVVAEAVYEPSVAPAPAVIPAAQVVPATDPEEDALMHTFELAIAIGKAFKGTSVQHFQAAVKLLLDNTKSAVL